MSNMGTATFDDVFADQACRWYAACYPAATAVDGSESRPNSKGRMT